MWDVLSGMAKKAWDVMSGVTKTVWDALSRATKTAWDVSSMVANLCGMFCPGCQKMAWDVFPGMFCPAPELYFHSQQTHYFLPDPTTTPFLSPESQTQLENT